MLLFLPSLSLIFSFFGTFLILSLKKLRAAQSYTEPRPTLQGSELHINDPAVNVRAVGS